MSVTAFSQRSWRRSRDRYGALNSCRARHFNLFGQRQRQTVRVGRLGQPDTDDLGTRDRDPFVDGVHQFLLLLWYVRDLEGLAEGAEPLNCAMKRYDVIDGQVGGRMSRASIARAPVAVLTTPDAEHAGAKTLPRPCAVEGVVSAAVRLARVVSAAATRAARDDTTDRAQLHRRHRPRVVPQVALVTLEHTSVDIVMSVER